MKLIFFFFMLFVVSTVLNAQNQPTLIHLSTGEQINLLTESQINDDWNEDFEDNKINLINDRKISDYLDGTRGTFSLNEKGFWIAHYDKSSNIKTLTKHNQKKVIIYKIYYIQSIFLRANDKLKRELSIRLYQLINKIYPIQISLNDIIKIRLASTKHYLSSTASPLRDFIRLDQDTQNIVAHFYIDKSELNRKRILEHYSNLLSDVQSAVRNLQIFLNTRIKLTNIDSLLARTLKAEEQKKRQIVLNTKNKSDLFLVTLVKINNRRLFEEAVRNKTSFVNNLRLKYIVARDYYSN